MFGHNYYHSAIRKYVIMFGNMFNDIDVVRYDNSGNPKQTIRVPIAYGPKETYLARLNQDPSLNKQAAIQLPRLSFEVTGYSYDSTRALNKLQRNTAIGASGDTLRSQHVPVPYNMEFTLYGMFANQEDAVQVVEQILPFFRPEWTHSMKLVPEMGEYFDVPTVLNGMTVEDTYESDYQSRRAIIYSFTFTVKGYLFGPVTNKGVIKRVTLDVSQDTPTETPVSSRIVKEPALLANGSPTFDSTLSIPTSQISANSDYGISFEKEDYFYNKDHGHGS